ncbi:hypothetical protein B6A10_01530 [Flavobacterium sp. L1I52]|uniref:Uncharacterized protein n=1 Tax=Flavobacterium pokkalii TaxID=1940408 RepID=A0ABR7ULV4_9FLAO|nr:hypothetical protein [Flavobacterium pokkalii]MBD0723854.1 hypothetical protein [Flavobacterium pokkalii]
MKNKYFILALTFLCMLVGQISYSQDWNDGGDYQDYYDDFLFIAFQGDGDSHWTFDDNGNAYADYDSGNLSGDVITSSMEFLNYDFDGGADNQQITEMMYNLTEEQMDLWATLDPVTVDSATNFDHEQFMADVTASYLAAQDRLFNDPSSSPDLSSIAEDTLKLLPVVGALYQSGEALENGDYLAAGGYLLWAGLDLYTLGAFSEAGLLIRASAVIAEEVVATQGTNLLVEALGKVGGSRAASEFLGWGNQTTILKSASDFTAEQLIESGYTKQVLTEIYTGLMEAAQKTIPSTGELNPASIARANQIQEILTTLF